MERDLRSDIKFSLLLLFCLFGFISIKKLFFIHSFNLYSGPYLPVEYKLIEMLVSHILSTQPFFKPIDLERDMSGTVVYTRVSQQLSVIIVKTEIH